MFNTDFSSVDQLSLAHGINNLSSFSGDVLNKAQTEALLKQALIATKLIFLELKVLTIGLDLDDVLVEEVKSKIEKCHLNILNMNSYGDMRKMFTKCWKYSFC